MVPDGNVFTVTQNFIIVTKVEDEAAQTVSFQVSKDAGRTFNAAIIPGVGQMKAPWFIVLDSYNGNIIVHIDSQDDIVHIREASSDDSQKTVDAIVGNIYMSDLDGFRYTVSLEHNIRSSDGQSAFEKIVPLDGVFLANIRNPNSHDDESVLIRTVISFDKGGIWKPLVPPARDAHGNQYPCIAEGVGLEHCSLHIHVTSPDGDDVPHSYPPVYSSKAAVGIVIGIGNVGESLRYEREHMSVFCSRDAGLTWFEAHAGAFIYEIADHGGIMTIADDLSTTNQILFSFDEGMSWYDMLLSDTPFEVNNIVTDSTGASSSFIVTAKYEDGKGVIFHLDFATKLRKCQGALLAHEAFSDYEHWTPTDQHRNGCLFGVERVYTRRKANSECLNGQKFERVVRMNKCVCTWEDYMCDIGFERPIDERECELAADLTDLVPATCKGEFTLTKYRKVPGNMCSGGWRPVDLDQITVPCPGDRATRSFKYLILFVGVALVASRFLKKRQAPSLRVYDNEGAELPMISLEGSVDSSSKDMIDLGTGLVDMQDSSARPRQRAHDFSASSNIIQG